MNNVKSNCIFIILTYFCRILWSGYLKDIMVFAGTTDPKKIWSQKKKT